jgi:hypothetical protein
MIFDNNDFERLWLEGRGRNEFVCEEGVLEIFECCKNIERCEDFETDSDELIHEINQWAKIWNRAVADKKFHGKMNNAKK